MIAVLVGLGIGLGLTVVLWVAYNYDGELGVGATIAFTAALVVAGCTQDPKYIAKEKQEKIEEARRAVEERTPRAVSSADGCTVYTFKSEGRWHYFTRCGNNATTEASYKVSCGKNCSKTVTEVITTEGKK